MKQLKAISFKQPILFSLLLVITCISILYSTVLLNLEDEFTKDITHSIVKNIITISLLYMIIKFNWLKDCYLTSPFRQWHSKWWLAALPMALIALLNILSLDVSLLEFSFTSTVGWLYTNLSTGLFEEILLRGVCFHVLYSAWKNNKNALMCAAISQAVIFGLAHYINLTKAPFIEVSIQVIYSTLIGIGFAGLVAFSRSLWPAIAIHTLINAMGSINNFFQPNYIAAELSIANYAVVIFIIALLCGLPGYLLLRAKQTQIRSQALVMS